MANLLSDETLERTLETNRRVLDGPQNNPLRPPMVPFHSPAIRRAVLITSPTPTSGRYPCKLQWRFESTPTWSDFTPSITGWAISYNGEQLGNDQRYDGMMVSVNPADNLPVWACDTSGDKSRYVNCLDEVPTGGLYNGRLQVENDDGTLSDTGPSVWIREANGISTLLAPHLYLCRRTGYTNGRDVYTLEDYHLIVGNTTLTQVVQPVFAFLVSPDHTWDVAEIAPRVCWVERLFRVEVTGGTPGYDQIKKIIVAPANNWDLTNPALGDVQLKRLFVVQDDQALPPVNDVWKLQFQPYWTWTLTTEAAGHAGVKRIMEVKETGAAAIADVKLITFDPAVSWDVAAGAQGEVIVQRLLTIREETTSKTTNTWQIDFSPSTAWDVTATAAGHATVERLLNVRDGTVGVTTHTWQIDFSPAAAWVVTATAAGHATVERTLQVFEGASQRGDSNIYKMVLLDDDFDVTGSGGEISEIKLHGATETLYLLECCDGGTTLKARQFTITRGSVKTIGSRTTAPACA